jgi:hypothetical protein
LGRAGRLFERERHRRLELGEEAMHAAHAARGGGGVASYDA